MQVQLTVNGAAWTGEVEPRLLLVHLIRERLGLRGTKVGCDTSNCGACTVLLGGRSVKSCTVLAVQADGEELTTVEHLADPGGGEAGWHPLQRAFHRYHALQCGYCTPGMLMSAASLLDEAPNPTEDEIRHGLEGNTCRCTGYETIVAAVAEAAAELAGQAPEQPPVAT
jgi:carbon-monoxide dehydrogenase small subunit